MRKLHCRPFLAALFTLVLAAAAPAAAQLSPGLSPAGETQVFLLTMGPGDQVWERFGHNAIWIHDPVRGTDRVYNYGVFDFDSPGYWSRFIKGDWLYQLAAADIYQTMAQYQYLNRTVTAQELNLTAAQKAELQSFLETNLLPENREYLYDYFRDNCSTRVRDAIDGVIGGRLRAATADEPTDVTFRWHSRRLLAEQPVTYTGLEAGLGPRADREITRWEEMFLPEKLQERVREVRVPGPDGAAVPLVAREEVLYAAVAREPVPAGPPGWIPRYLLIGAALGGLLAWLGRAARRSGLARFGFASLAALWSLAAGIGGLLLVGLWALTNHQIAHANENLLQLSPLALPLVLLAPAAAFGARWAARPARWLALAVAASSLLGLLLQPLPWFDQVNGEIIALALPVNLALAWVLARWAPDATTPAPAAGPKRSAAGEAPALGTGHSALGTR